MSKEEQADKLIEQYIQGVQLYFQDYAGAPKRVETLSTNEAIKCALIDNQNTIDAFEELTDDRSSWEGYKEKALRKLEFHKAVRTILKSKLK